MTTPAAAAATVVTSSAPASRSGTAPPTARRLPSRPPVAPGMGPSKAGTPPPPVRRRGPAGPRGKTGKPPAKPPAKKKSVTPAEIRRRAPTTRYEGKNYQPAILAEFVAAIILVSATPFATSKNPEGLSPYAGSDIVKLLALTMTYLILALISSAGRSAGKYAALFGLLILLAVGLNEAANVVTAFDLLAGIPLPGGGESTNKTPAPGGGGSGGRSVPQ